MNWRTLVIIAICAVLLAGYGVLKHRDDDITPTVTQLAQPGYYMNDATIVQTGSDGMPRITLRASHIEQHPDHNNVTLDTVAVDYLGVANTPWLLTAQQGTLAPDSRIIVFNGDVSIHPQGTATLPLVLHTDELHIDTENNVATAPGKVSIVMNQQLLTAVGLHADLQRQHVHLESKVHGEFYSH